jgi:hypothetical protein
MSGIQWQWLPGNWEMKKRQMGADIFKKAPESA